MRGLKLTRNTLVLSLGAVALGTSLLAGGAADAGQSLPARALKEAAIRDYLEIAADKGPEALTETKELPGSDIDGDGITDSLLLLRHKSSNVLAAFGSAAKAGEAAGGEAALLGYVRVDADELPAVEAADLNSDGVADLRIEAVRIGKNRAATKSLILVSLKGGKVSTLWRGVTESTERALDARQKRISVVSAVDLDGDGKNELQIVSRAVETVGEGAAEKEVAETTAIATAVYALKDGRYVLRSTEAAEQTLAQKLAAADALEKAGARERAAAIANEVVAAADAPAATVDGAKALIERIASASAEAEAAAATVAAPTAAPEAAAASAPATPVVPVKA
jgi:hypothetical protein